MNSEKQLLNRKMYKDIKRYDREQMELFAKNLYMEGLKDGAKSVEVEVEIDIDSIVNRIKEMLRVRLGIGNIRFNRANIEQDIKEMFKGEINNNKEN